MSGETSVACAPPIILTIAIPTFNRAVYLSMNLQRLLEEMPLVLPGEVEVIVSDNHSVDATPEIVAGMIDAGLPIRYLRNSRDLGSDANIAQCFNEARGDYVQIMGDDDLYVRGVLGRVVAQLKTRQYGVLCLRPFGYEKDPDTEHPGGAGSLREYTAIGEFLVAAGPLITFISAVCINRRIQPAVDARVFCGSNLVQVHLVMNAAVRARENACMTEYMLACKRNNSGGYDFSEVFVERLGRILDTFCSDRLSARDIERFETRMLLSYHPFNLLRQRIVRAGDLDDTYRRFQTRFGKRALFRFWVAPIILLPRPLALAWGALAAIVGRLIYGELRRGIRFAQSRARLFLHARRSAQRALVRE